MKHIRLFEELNEFEEEPWEEEESGQKKDYMREQIINKLGGILKYLMKNPQYIKPSKNNELIFEYKKNIFKINTIPPDLDIPSNEIIEIRIEKPDSYEYSDIKVSFTNNYNILYNYHKCLNISKNKRRDVINYFSDID